KAGDVIRARINGALVPLTKQRLTPDQTRAIALRLLPNDADRGRIDHLRDYDCSWGLAGVGRFRVNILRQRSSFMIVMRVMPFAVPSFEDLGLPAAVQRLADLERGLVLVTGPRGSGKSSTVAALIHHINSTRSRHIVTVEDPIEFLHRDLNSSVTQREVGVDTDSLAQGVRSALRQDPDVVALSDIPDARTLESAVKAAEDGHLVLASLSGADIPTIVERLLGLVDADVPALGRVRFAEQVAGATHQRLLPRIDGDGRIAAVEVMIATPEVRAVLRDPPRLGDLKALIAKGRGKHGMQTLEQHLQELVATGLVSAETAKATLAG
ncbi:MAG: type IV pilus twitching motility protein PilT, partial [Gemmatimonadota bacterium]